MACYHIKIYFTLACDNIIYKIQKKHLQKEEYENLIVKYSEYKQI